MTPDRGRGEVPAAAATPPPPPMIPRLLPSLSALVVYATASAAFFGIPVLGRLSTVSMAGSTPSAALTSGTDTAQFMWFLVWWPHAVRNAINPFVSKIVFAPNGLNLTWTTSVPAVAVLATPLTLAVGPVASFNLLMLLAPVLSAWSAFFLCWYFVRRFVPALVGGLLFGFSSYETAQLSVGHLNLVYTCLVPLAVLLCARLLDGEIRRFPFTMLLASAIVLQLGTSTEILATATFFGGVALATAFMVIRARRRDLLKLAGAAAAAYLLAAVIALPFLYYLSKGFSDVPRALWDVDWFSTDLANFVIPTTRTWLGGSLFAPVTARFVGNLGEQDAYLGIPLLLTIIAAALGHRRSTAGKILGACGLAAALASMGPALHVLGHGGRLASLPMPWALFGRLPVLGLALPARFVVYLTLVVALAVALWLRHAAASPRTKTALAIASVVFLLPAGWSFYAPVEVPAFFAKHLYRQYLQPGETVLVVPYRVRGQSMLWQALSGMYFRMVGGYAAYDNPDFVRWGILDSLRSGTPFPGYVRTFQRFLSSHDVRFVIVADDNRRAWQTFFSPLLGSGTEIGNVTLYDVRRSSPSHP